MYTRTTTVTGSPDAIDAGIAQVRDEVFPAVREMPGFVGMSFVADRSSGRCIATTAWESERALADSRQAVQPLRDRVVDLLQGKPHVEEWEVAVMHRRHDTPDGACVRVTRLRMDPAEADHGIDVFRMGALPRLDELEGFCSASLMVDRANGLAVSTVAYESRQALENTRESGQRLREQVARESGSEVTGVEEYDLVFAHLHMPEMA